MDFRFTVYPFISPVFEKVGRNIDIAFGVRVDDEVRIVQVGVIEKRESEQANDRDN